MKLSFHGAAQTVTGSCHLLKCNGKSILVDCGMFQGGRELFEDNSEPFGFDPAKVDVLVLTHAHLDHCGRIPLLVRQGFKGEIICTAATRELTRLILLDSAHLHEEEAKRRRRHGQRNKGSAPLYDTIDALDSLEYFGRTAHYGKPLELAPGIHATFHDAGHILGSASVLLDLSENGKRRTILFSGDIGPQERSILNAPHPPTGVDYVVMESTYGDRDHRPVSASVDEFTDVVSETLLRGGNVIIPTFALERAQELLFALHQANGAGRLASSTRVFLDSPMAISATRIFSRHPSAMNPKVARMIGKGQDPFSLPHLAFVRDAAESAELNRIHSGAIIMAGSGMCTGGRIRHHLRHNLAQANNSIVFVGYAAEGTLARIIIEGAKTVKLFGDRVKVKAQIHTINGFSAHAGRSDLIKWAQDVKPNRAVFLVHGDAKTGMAALCKALRGLAIDTHRPAMHESFDLH